MALGPLALSDITWKSQSRYHAYPADRGCANLRSKTIISSVMPWNRKVLHIGIR